MTNQDNSRQLIVTTAATILMQLEGFSSKPYKCSAGVYTIGYGSTRLRNLTKVNQFTTPVSKDEAYDLLDNELDYLYSVTIPLIKVKLTNNQYAAILSFVYNVGFTAFKNSSLLVAINSGNDRQIVTAQFKRWIWAGGKPILTRRREIEVGLYWS